MSEFSIAQTFQAAFASHQTGRLAEAEVLYREILKVAPDMPSALHLLGVLAHQTDRHEEAIGLLKRSLAAHPNNAAALSSLGELYLTTDEPDQARVCFDRALGLNPKLAPAHHHLGTMLLRSRRLEEARECFERAVASRPDYFEAHRQLGTVLLDLNRLPEALVCFERAVTIQPDHAEAHNCLGIALERLHRSEEACRCFARAIDLRPDDAEAHNNLGNVLKGMAQIHAAVASYRRALTLTDDSPEIHSNLIYALHFDPETDAATLRAECARWERFHAAPLRHSVRPHTNDPDPLRRLRIGYVSPDFRNHPISNFIAPLLAAHDGTRFEVHCYSDVEHADQGTARLQSLADCWHRVSDLSDDALAGQIRADGIDILVDLALHSEKNRLPVFARKPAPVQVSWLGYAGSSGLTSIDYRVTDALIEPPGLDNGTDWPPEQSLRLPASWCCYEGPGDAPPVGSLPALADGGAHGVTFGSLNQFGKCNERVFRLWARVLGAVPGSRLLLHCHEPAALNAARLTLEREGIVGSRLRSAPWMPKRDYLRLYDQIDVGLDPFPHNGMTTTCEALWMGVPVVTLAGTLPVSRTGLSLLTTVGLPEWAVRNEDDYVRLAAQVAGDLPSLAALRDGLREQMRHSPLMDAPRFVAHWEASFRLVWQRWCILATQEGSNVRPRSPE